MAEPVSETEGAVGAHWGDRGFRPTAEPYFFKSQPNTACCGFNIYRFAGVTPLINLVDLNQIFQE